MAIMKSWKEFNQVITEKKLDPVGREDSDVDNDYPPSDKYLMKRRKAKGEEQMGGKKKKSEESSISAELMLWTI